MPSASSDRLNGSRASTAIVIAATIGFVSAAAAAVNPIRSRFTTIELKSCEIIERRQQNTSWRCNGLHGYPVLYSEAGQHTYVSFGTNGLKLPAARQTLPAPNTVFSKTGRRATVEWRFRRIGGRDIPYATIMRMFTTNGDSKREVLVVTKVTATTACHMAYVDAKLNADAMATARSAADELASGWSCTAPPRVIGAEGAQRQ